MNRSLVLAVVVAGIASTALGCHRSRDGDGEDDEDEDSQDLQRTHYWRVQIAIMGRGSVRDPSSKIDCTAHGTSLQDGRCGPELFTFEELAPPLLRATGAAGWRFDHWLSTTRTGPMPDGRYYVNGLGYRDTGVLERVTAVFVPAPDGLDDVSTPSSRGTPSRSRALRDGYDRGILALVRWREGRDRHCMGTSDAVGKVDLITLDEAERRHAERVLRACRWNRTVAAQVLGVDRKTLYRKLVRWGLSDAGPESSSAADQVERPIDE